MTRNFNRDVIICIAYNMFIIRPIWQNDFITTIQNSGNYVSLVVVEFKITVFLNDVSV